MKDDNYEKPENDNSEEIPVFSDQDLEDYLDVEEKYSSGEEAFREVNPPPQTLGLLKRQRRSRRSLIFVALLILGLGILVLAFFRVMKPEVKKPQIVAKPMRRSIPSVERKEEPMASGIVGKREREDKLPEGSKPEGKKPSLPKPPEAPLMSRERGTEEKVVVIGGTEIPKRDEGEKVTEAERKGPSLAGRIETKPGETKPRFAKVEEPKILAMPQQKLPVGRYTVNIGSFRKRVWAEQLIKELDEKDYKAFIEETIIPKKGTWYRVAVGRFPSRREAQSFARGLKERHGINSFVRKLKEVKQ